MRTCPGRLVEALAAHGPGKSSGFGELSGRHSGYLALLWGEMARERIRFEQMCSTAVQTVGDAGFIPGYCRAAGALAEQVRQG